MKKQLLSITTLLITLTLNAQVGINTQTPDASSVLDIVSTNKGVLLPRVSLNSITQQLSSAPNAVGLMIYNPDSTNLSKGFYSWDGTKWIQFIDETRYKDTSYWIPQGTVGTFTNGNNNQNQQSSSSFGPTSGSGTTTPAYTVDIYQKGNVGIGYNSSADIDFALSPSQKKLEVGGDVRAVFTDTTNNRYYGIETNTNGLPDFISGSGNAIFNAKTKNAGDFDNYAKVFDGSGIFQNQDDLVLGSRNGTSTANNLNLTFSHIQPTNITNVVSENGAKTNIEQLDQTKYVVSNANEGESNYSFGLKFPAATAYDTHSFFIGNGNLNENGYFFPSTAGTSKQILQLENDPNNLFTKNKLVWKNPEDVFNSDASPKFFYMPSVVLPTTTGDALIGTGATANYKYDAATQTFSVNLYALFSGQFTAPIATSSSTSTLTEFVKTADKYDYIVTAADSTIFTNVSVDATGLLKYKVNTNGIIKTGSFMNIVLKVK